MVTNFLEINEKEPIYCKHQEENLKVSLGMSDTHVNFSDGQPSEARTKKGEKKDQQR